MPHLVAWLKRSRAAACAQARPVHHRASTVRLASSAPGSSLHHIGARRRLLLPWQRAPSGRARRQHLGELGHRAHHQQAAQAQAECTQQQTWQTNGKEPKQAECRSHPEASMSRYVCAASAHCPAPHSACKTLIPRFESGCRLQSTFIRVFRLGKLRLARPTYARLDEEHLQKNLKLL